VASFADDYVLESEEHAPATSQPTGATQENPADAAFDEYFDSAPIPGVDMSQTSDHPAGHTGRR
jgi:HemY protein